ncbi:MAG: hypothetical protein ACXADY_24420 [Candidatus Hodarchaeales archaeon]|jgi:hypothetical protein
MAFNKRWKAELGISALIFVEFFGVTIWAFLTAKNDIIIPCAVLMAIGFLFISFKLYEAKFQVKRIDDERIEMLTEQAYLISAIAGIIMLTQLTIFEILTETTISTLNTFFIVVNTVFFVFVLVEFIQYYFLS